MHPPFTLKTPPLHPFYTPFTLTQPLSTAALIAQNAQFTQLTPAPLAPPRSPRYSPFAPPLHSSLDCSDSHHPPFAPPRCLRYSPFAPPLHPPHSPYTSLTPSHPLDTHPPIKPLHTPLTTPPLHTLFPSHAPETLFTQPPLLTPPLHSCTSLHCTAEEPVKPQRAQKAPKSPTKKPLKRTTSQDLSVPTMKSAFFSSEIDDFGHPPFYPRRARKQAFLPLVQQFGAFFQQRDGLSSSFKDVRAC